MPNTVPGWSLIEFMNPVEERQNSFLGNQFTLLNNSEYSTTHGLMLLEINFQTFTGSESVIFCPVILGSLFQNFKIFKHFASTTVIAFPISFT